MTEDGGLRLYADNIAPGSVLTAEQLGATIIETVGQITETDDTVTVPTTGSITVGSGKILTSRTVTLRQVDDASIEMTDSTVDSNEAGDKAITNTCTGTITQ